jgi:hypothetical protein
MTLYRIFNKGECRIRVISNTGFDLDIYPGEERITSVIRITLPEQGRVKFSLEPTDDPETTN